MHYTNTSTVSTTETSYNQLQSGQVFAHYTIQEKLGSGGMSVVYRAHDNRLHRIVALKIVNKQQQSYQSLVREAQLMSKVNHPNIVNIYDVGTVPCFYFTMECVSGEILSKWASNNNDYSIENLAPIFMQLASAVGEIHKYEIIHRDIKPSNILITENKQIKLMDFGISRVTPKNIARNVLENTPVGTPKYMAPEQVSGNASPRSDIYGIGATLYSVLCGKAPFQGKSYNVMVEVLTKEPIVPSELNPDISSELEAICLKCMQKNPENRYITTKQLMRDFKNAQEHKTIIAKKYTRFQAAKKFVRRHALKVSVCMLLIVILMFVALYETIQRQRLQKQNAKIEKQNQQLEELHREMEEVRQVTAKTLREAFQKGRHLQKNDQFLEPIRQLLNSIPKSEERYAILHNIAFGLSKNPQHAQKGIASADKLIQKNPENYKNYNMRANIHYANKNYPLALQDYNRSIQLHPKNEAAFIGLGNLFFQAKKYALSEKNYNFALQVNPESADAYYNKGRLKAMLGNIEVAIFCYEQALLYDPSFSNAYNNLSLLYQRKKEFDKALENATKAISLEKGNWKIIYNKGNILAQKEQYKDAVKYYEKALSIVKKESKIWMKLGFIHSRLGNKEKAIHFYEQVVAAKMNVKHVAEARKKLQWLYKK